MGFNEFLEKIGLQKLQKGRSGGSFNSTFVAGREYIDPKDKTSLLQAYRNWVYICANKNATAVSKQPLRLYVTKTDEKKKCLQTSEPC